MTTAPQPEGPSAELREFLGKLVRAEWVRWAREQPSPKPSWLESWNALTEPEREVDRRIGEAVWRFSYVRDLHPAPLLAAPEVPAPVGEPVALAWLPIIGAVPKALINDRGLQLLVQLVESIAVHEEKRPRRVLACWDHTTMFELRDYLCDLAAPAVSPPPAAQEIAEAFERGRLQGMDQERALWEMARDAQELGLYPAAQEVPQEVVRDAMRWGIVLACVRQGQHGEWVIHEDDPHNADGTKAMFAAAIDRALASPAAPEGQ